MNESEQISSEHIAVEELASLSEPGSKADPAMVAHLARCHRCVAIYAEFVHTRASFLNDPDAEMPPADLLERALQIPLPAAASRAGVGGHRRQWWIPSAAAVLVAAGLFWLWPMVSHEPSAVPPELQARLSERMRTDSYGGLLYDDALPLPRETRGSAADSSEADLAVLRLSHQSAETPDPEVAYWLIAGLLATNQQRGADPYIRQSLDRFPDDARFHNLAAIQAYKRSDLQLAEKELLAAQALDPSAVFLLNLAQVVTEAGRPAEAATLLSELVERYPSSRVAGLARERAAALGSGLR